MRGLRGDAKCFELGKKSGQMRTSIDLNEGTNIHS
ncbi:hypothetical protein L917_17621 [Phytophthora nicotianae]|uniref:Uncharacterized protein n=1 Tax=Phytophthora nicotianae TaxID=4792 RepID=W2KAA6_PHYNI|nr:hypothetical protein L916_17793 [Phytophthora nicotianae]ETL82156.1 hypothetical protein L917_17621 [Phytophthora nicotianae]